MLTVGPLPGPAEVVVHADLAVHFGLVFAHGSAMPIGPVGLQVKIRAESVGELLVDAALLLAQKVRGLEVILETCVVPKIRF